MRVFGRLAQYLLVLLIPFIYLFLAIFTLSDYGINWDEPYHFHRGQAYLHYLMTGRTDFKDLPPYPNLTPECGCDVCDGGPEGPTDRMRFSGKPTIYEDAVAQKVVPGTVRRRSLFQAYVYDFSYFIDQDKKFGGHPPANDILAAFTNYIFYQKLNVLGDIEAHHLFEVLVVFFLVAGVAVFTYLHFGLLSSMVASVCLAFYPLVFAESHFNIKDPPEMAFFGLSIIAFSLGMTREKWFLLIASAVFAGLALGTKFNAIFLPFVPIPWLAFCLLKQGKLKLTGSSTLALAAFPLVTLAVFYVLWPYLWGNPVENLKPVFEFYRQSGTTLLPELNSYVYKGFNFFPVTWIAITTPLPILLLALVGLATSFFRLVRDKHPIYFLILLWFLLPIIRVTLPGTAIHSGVRHIMEFIPAMAILAGVGVQAIHHFLKQRTFKALFVAALVSVFSFVVWEVARLHPNENVYFNQLIGGLPGAREKSIPYWGYSYGNVYLQGVQWLNANAEPDAKLTLLIGTMSNVPWPKLRSDIQYHNRHWSGPEKRGEYAIEMIHNSLPMAMYRFAYYEKFLDPVYEVKVDGVAILKIWKNDLEHTRPGFDKEIAYMASAISLIDDNLEIDLGQEITLTRVVIEHGSSDCQKQQGGYAATSIDGKTWMREPEPIDVPQSPPEASPEIIGFDQDSSVFLFPARRARLVTIDTTMKNSCYLKNPTVSIYGLASSL